MIRVFDHSEEEKEFYREAEECTTIDEVEKSIIFN